jgi:hypothetical protein
VRVGKQQKAFIGTGNGQTVCFALHMPVSSAAVGTEAAHDVGITIALQDQSRLGRGLGTGLNAWLGGV